MRRGEGVFLVGMTLNACGLVLLAAGAALGWGVTRLSVLTAQFPGLVVSPASQHLDVSSYLGADITALAVIIAVVIGFNATALQIAGQSHALAVVRGILVSLVPFLLCWVLTTGVALVYFLAPTEFVAQLWQMLLWFAAIVALVLAYLWGLPWRLSGSYVAAWAVRELRGKPLERWEPLDGYSALLSSVASASARGDVGTLRALTTRLGTFLARRLDSRAESENVHVRGRYRALKNLLSGCAQNADQGPNSVAYYLGYVLAGTMLQGVAVGVAFDDPARDMYSGLLRVLRGAPERIDPLWTGMRHALCRSTNVDQPLLIRYWEAHRAWAADDPRLVERIAVAVARLYASAQGQMSSAQLPADASAEDAPTMLSDLYRDLATHLAPMLLHVRPSSERQRLLARSTALLDAVHSHVLAAWGLPTGDPGVALLSKAYEQYRAQLGGPDSLGGRIEAK
jgi:hypothetical protein